MPVIRSSTSFFVLFVCLIVIAIPVVVFLPNLKSRPEPVPVLQVSNLLKNCAFFYQRCETSSYGTATNQTVDQLLTEIGSPLQQAPSLLHTSLNKPTSVRTQPSQILTLIASEYNINPFLLLTLSEMEDNTVTLANNLTQEVEQGGEQQAWFSLRHQFIAKELQEYAMKDGLAPNSETSWTKATQPSFASLIRKAVPTKVYRMCGSKDYN